MALINCPECKQEISDIAKQCPNCGYPLRTKKLLNQLQDFKNEINTKKEQAKDLSRVKCKKCGYEAGNLNLTNGLCEECNPSKKT